MWILPKFILLFLTIYGRIWGEGGGGGGEKYIAFEPHSVKEGKVSRSAGELSASRLWGY
jgi:hypothetical protein